MEVESDSMAETAFEVFTILHVEKVSVAPFFIGWSFFDECSVVGCVDGERVAFGVFVDHEVELASQIF